jgi:hypothetical protein
MKSKYFNISELVSPLILKAYKNPEEAWGLLRIKLVRTLDALKEATQMTMVINTCAMPAELQKQYGVFSERGVRSIQAGVGKTTGAHYKGLACDIDFYKNGIRQKPQVIIDYIIKNRTLFPHICGIELGVNWNHIDCMSNIESPVRLPEGKILCFYSDGRSPIIY